MHYVLRALRLYAHLYYASSSSSCSLLKRRRSHNYNEVIVTIGASFHMLNLKKKKMV